MFSKTIRLLAAAVPLLMAAALPAHASDLLVAPTRLVFDNPRGTEVVLNNIGSNPATYRISLEIKRMTALGALEAVAEADHSAAEKAVLDMISFSPRRVTLPPNQPQVIRVGVRLSDDIPAGEYRAHMLFRAIPDTTAVTERAAAPGSGVSVSLTPIYGITIPVIVRVGTTGATAKIGRGWVSQDQDNALFNFELARQGDRSVYGDIEVSQPGRSEPLFVARGIAVYPELTGRTVSIPVPNELAAALRGPVRIRYTEDRELGAGLIDEAERVVE